MLDKISSHLVLILFGLFFLWIGFITLIWPERVQQFYLSFYKNANELAKLNPFLKWMESPSYVISLRIIGIVSILAGVFAIYVYMTSNT